MLAWTEDEAPEALEPPPQHDGFTAAPRACRTTVPPALDDFDFIADFNGLEEATPDSEASAHWYELDLPPLPYDEPGIEDARIGEAPGCCRPAGYGEEAGAGLPPSETLNLDLIEVDITYDGPHYRSGEITQEFCMELMECQRQQKVLMKRYAYEVVLDAIKLLCDMETVVSIQVPEGHEMTVCGDIHGQYYDLLNISEMNGVPSDCNPYLFNGDLVLRCRIPYHCPRKGVSVVLNKTEETLPSVQQVMVAWASGQQQVLIARGPINARSVAVSSVLTAPVRVVASPQGVRVDSAHIDARRSFLGHQSRTGGPCMPLAADCLRGAVVSAPSGSWRPVRLSRISFRVDLPQDLGYDVRLAKPRLAPPWTLKCASESRLWDLETAAGMWSYLDPSRFADQFVDLPGSQAGLSRALTTFFLRGVSPDGPPDPFTACAADNANVGPPDGQQRHLSCCLASRLTAAACYYRRKGASVIPAISKGSQTLVIDGFNIDLKLPYWRMPIFFDESILTLWLGPWLASCHDFTFY